MAWNGKDLLRYATHDGEAAPRKVRIREPGLLILALMRPGIGGLDIY